MISDADAVRWAVRVMPQLAAKADGRPDELGQQYLDRLTALADRLETHALIPREPSDDDLNAIHYALTGEDEGYTNRAYYEGLHRAMLTASEAKC